MQNNTQYIEEDKIDLKELYAILKRRKKLIGGVTVLFTLLAVVYTLTATRWWQVNATLEIGKYIDNKTGKEIYLENASTVSERLKIQYIDVYEHVKDRDSEIQSINSSKKNSQFISITALGKENKLAQAKIQKVIDELQNKHQKIIEEIIAKKQSTLDHIDRDIFQVTHNKIPQVAENIAHIKKVVLPSNDKKIVALESSIKNSITQKNEVIKNLTSFHDESSLAALRMVQIQRLEYEISENEIKVIDLNSKKQELLATILPTLTRERERLTKIDLATLQEERELTILSMQPHNYNNTRIVGSIITQDKPVKPKKALSIIVAFITSLMLSVFLAFFLEVISSPKEKDSKNSE